MALEIKDEGTVRLARALAAETGESVAVAVSVAVRERLERVRGFAPRERRDQELARLVARSSSRPVRDHRGADEILGYRPDGLAG